MDNLIKSVDRGSPLHGKAHPGDAVISINGHKIIDVLDYKFFAYDSELHVVLRHPDGSEREVHVRKTVGGDLGLEFESYLMDTPRSCANNCVFCFIDQLPKGMRRTMYFKDDDARLSFLLGNYITLTNLSKRDKRLRPHDESGTSLCHAAQSARRRDDKHHAPLRGIRHHDELPDRLLPRSQRRGGAYALNA